MNRYAMGNGILQGFTTGVGLIRDIERDKESKRQFDEQMGFRREQAELDNARADERLGFQRVQHARAQQESDLQFQEHQNKLLLRRMEGLSHLIQHGNDNGLLSGAMNEMEEYSGFLSSRNLNEAKFDRIEMNTSGKGQPGAVTIIKGQDKNTGQERRGVVTDRASSDLDDPVSVMPIREIVRMGRDLANQGEHLDPDKAQNLRKNLLTLVEAERLRLGGTPKEQEESWSPIQYDKNGMAYQQSSTTGKISVLDKSGRYSPMRSRINRGGGSGKSSASANQIYRQVKDAFPDDPMQQMDNSILRNLTVSLAQDFDRQSGGALAEGVYVQVAQEASQGLALSPQAATQSAIDELNQGKLWGGYDADDEEVQQRAKAILERDKGQYAERFLSAVGSMVGMRQDGQMPASQLSQPQSQPRQALPTDASLDEVAAQMVERAQASGKSVSIEQAKEYLMNTYPDRFGDTQQPVESEPTQPRRKRYGMTLEEQAHQFDKDVLDPTRQGFRSLASRMNEGAKGEKVRAQFYAAAKSGSMPPPATLVEWMRYLPPEDQQAAAEYLQQYHPDDPATQRIQGQGN